jgi:heme O synthase-like polyprenyltransferase
VPRAALVNDLWDRDIDPQVQRTKTRPLAAKALSVWVAIALAVLMFLCAYGLTFYLNPLSFALCVAAVPVIVLYPLAKRVFPVPQLVLAIAWGFAVLIPWAAVTGTLELATWLLWAAVIFWTWDSIRCTRFLIDNLTSNWGSTPAPSFLASGRPSSSRSFLSPRRYSSPPSAW